MERSMFLSPPTHTHTPSHNPNVTLTLKQLCKYLQFINQLRKISHINTYVFVLLDTFVMLLLHSYTFKILSKCKQNQIFAVIISCALGDLGGDRVPSLNSSGGDSVWLLHVFDLRNRFSLQELPWNEKWEGLQLLQWDWDETGVGWTK